MNVALNGFGRIGKNFLRACLLTDKLPFSLVGINIGPADIGEVPYMIKYDSLLRRYDGEVGLKNNILHIKNHRIELFTEKDPLKLPWQRLAVDWVVEMTGHFTDKPGAELHLKAGAKKVLISAPAKGEDVSIIPGINHTAYDANKHLIVSLGSCTTNALVPSLYVLHKTFTIERGFVNTVHAYTNSQTLLDIDATAKDPRRSRAAALNIIPSSTGAQKMIEKIIPDLKDKISATAVRVPVPTVSYLEVIVHTEKDLSNKSIHEAFTEFARNQKYRIIDLTNEPLVSSDFMMSPYSITIDTLLTQAHGPMGKLVGWYDNEWGYANRLVDFLEMAA
jgi:glyceraldehyde 3-phosphate dehydrogenase